MTIEEPTGSKSPKRGKGKFTFTPKSRAAANREKAAKAASNSIRSPRDDRLVLGSDATKSYKGFGTKKSAKKKHPENNLYKFDERYFQKKPRDPALFEVNVDRADYSHLMNDDLDEVSKLEVTYKILKQQMRKHQ